MRISKLVLDLLSFLFLFFYFGKTINIHVLRILLSFLAALSNMAKLTSIISVAVAADSSQSDFFLRSTQFSSICVYKEILQPAT